MTIIRKCSKCEEMKEMVAKNWCCRSCKNKYERERVKKNPERQKELGKAKYQKNKEKIYEKRLKRISDNPEKEREYQRKNYRKKRELGINLTRYRYDTAKKARERWTEKNPEKRRCQYQMHNAVKSGKLVRPDVCEICNKKNKIQGHHEDYKKPFDIVWCCVQCHAELDRKRREKLDG